MMQKRSTLSLLLISFMLVFALSVSANQVTFEDKTVTRCDDKLLNITVDNLVDIGAVEVIFEITGSGGSYFDAVNVNWDAGFGVLTNRIVDMSGVDYVSPDTIRIAAMLIDNGDVCLSSGQTIIAQVGFTTNDNCDGAIVLSGGSVSCPTFDIFTQFSDCGGTASIAAVVNAGTVTVQNQAPSLAVIADDELGWGATHSTTAVGSDFDVACEALKYSIVSGPAALTIDSVSGAIEWITTPADIGSHDVEVMVEDLCGATGTTSYSICVSNESPLFSVCPGNQMVALGELVDLTLEADDLDNGPAAFAYTLVENSGTSATIDAATGQFLWQTTFDPADQGTFDFMVVISDGGNIDAPCAPKSADTCSFSVSVVNFLVSIEKTHDAIQGQQETIDIIGAINTYEDSIATMGGFDFLIQYDATALTFQSAEEGQFLKDCGWEYFTYRYGYDGNCGTACPTGEIRVIAIAETNNGQGNHPDCFATDDVVSNQLVRLNFLVTNDRTFECMYAPVRFAWYDCGDNSISSKWGDYLFISNRIYNYEDSTINDAFIGDIADPTADFPTTLGANYVCDTTLENGKAAALRYITFVNGGVDIVCADSIDARGDLNLNEIAYEIADAVLYSNYFVYGMTVFDDDPMRTQGQIAASDVNADGLTLSVADLVYLIRVLIGDAAPYPKEVVNEATFVNATYQHADNGVIAVSDDAHIAAAHIVVAGDVEPTLLADNMTINSHFDGTNTRILVYSLENNSFDGDMINVGNNEIVSLEMADNQGNQVVAKWIPSNYDVAQNYPNPFNPTTTIDFSIPVADDVTMIIYNISGQKVTEFSGAFEAGVHSFEWDASLSASGVYFYRLTAGEFSAVKKMVLLK